MAEMKRRRIAMNAAPLFRFLADGSPLVICACLTFLMLVLMTACGPKHPPTSPETDRAALTLLYEYTEGPNWIRNANWLSDEPLGHWEGVTTDADGRVVELYLFQNNLVGFIPTDVGNLDKLVALDLANSYEDENDIGAVIQAWTEGLKSLFGAQPPEYNNLFGCAPKRLKGQLDMKKSFLGGLSFCDKTGEARMYRLALEYAIENGNVVEVRRLVRDEAIVKEASREGDELLVSAINQGMPEIVQILLEVGIKPACIHESGYTLLHRSVAGGNADMVRLLAGVCSDELNAVQEDISIFGYDRTPLSMAIEEGNVDVARVLIKAGADPNVEVSPDRDVDSHLAYAVELGHVAIVELLVGAGAGVGAQEGRELLSEAIWDGSAAMVAAIVKAGADVNATDESGRSMLGQARLHKEAEIVRILVDAGAREGTPLERDDGGTAADERVAQPNLPPTPAPPNSPPTPMPTLTPVPSPGMLFRAIRSGNADMVAAILEAGADVNATDERGRSVLHSAIVNRRADLVPVLVEAGADVNATDERGRSMLELARLHREAEIVRFLVDAGAQE